MRQSLYILFLLGFFSANAQMFNIDVNIEPKPYAEKEYLGDVITSPIKSALQINTVNIAKEIYNDTLWKYNYNEKGEKIKSTLYSNNKVNKLYDFTYENVLNGIIRYTKSENKITDISKTIYDEKKNVIEKRSYIMNVKDTLHVWTTNFKYADDKVLLRENKIDGNFNGLLEYSWNNKFLTKATLYSNIRNKKYFYEYEYRYDVKGRLTELVLFQQRDTVRDKISYNKYSYIDDLLVEEKYTTLNSPNEEIVATYKYDDRKKLEKTYVSKGKDEMSVSYTYDNFDNIISKAIRTNTPKLFKQLFTLTPYNISTDNPYNLIQNFEYDSKGNLISASHYVDEKLIWQTVYRLEYY